MKGSVLIESGGLTAAESVGRIMKKIFDDELAVELSLWGKQGNDNFSTTNFFNIMKGN